MTAAKLVRPSVDYKDSYLKALDEYHQNGEMLNLDKRLIAANFDEFVKNLSTDRGVAHQPYQDWVEPVPETILWMVKDGEYMGSVGIRHRLNWHLERLGGHLHFILRPSLRGKGFGKKMLLKAIPFANYLGIEKALITVDPQNTAAQHIIESCGGEMIDDTTATEQFPSRRRYWLNCS